MRTRVFTLRYSASLGGFDDRGLQEFTRDKERIAFREHFFTVNEVPHLTCVLTYQEPLVPGADAAGRASRSDKQDRSRPPLFSSVLAPFPSRFG